MASKREGVMLCYPYSEKRFLTQYDSKGLIQRKFNGDRCKAVIENGKVTLYSSQANEITNLQHINQELSQLPNITLDGELYLHGLPHQTIHSIVAQKIYPHEQSFLMEYHVFDLITNAKQFDRLVDLHHHLDWKKLAMKKVKLVDTKVVLTVKEIEMYYQQFVNEGFEGFIIRNPKGEYVEKRSTDIMKCKPRCQSVARVIVMNVAHTLEGIQKNMLGAFQCIDEETGVRFKVGTGLTETQRKEFWARGDKAMAGERLVYKYQELSIDNTPIFPVFVRMVKE